MKSAAAPERRRWTAWKAVGLLLVIAGVVIGTLNPTRHVLVDVLLDRPFTWGIVALSIGVSIALDWGSTPRGRTRLVLAPLMVVALVVGVTAARSALVDEQVEASVPVEDTPFTVVVRSDGTFEGGEGRRLTRIDLERGSGLGLQRVTAARVANRWRGETVTAALVEDGLIQVKLERNDLPSYADYPCWDLVLGSGVEIRSVAGHSNC